MTIRWRELIVLPIHTHRLDAFIVRALTTDLTSSFFLLCRQSPRLWRYLSPILSHLSSYFLNTSGVEFEPNENGCSGASIFGGGGGGGYRGQRTPLRLNRLHQLSPSLWQWNMWGWQYKQRWIDAFPRGRRKKKRLKRKMEKGEWIDGEMKVAAWHRECDSVMRAGFIVSRQHPGEIISSQYGVYQSSQNTTLPPGYMSRLSVFLYLDGRRILVHKALQNKSLLFAFYKKTAA